MRPPNQPLKSSWTVTRLGLIGAAIILVAVIAYTFYQGGRPRPAAPGSTSNNAALPENVMQASINLLDGQTTKLANYSGKILIVDLWATWCGPCRQEIPHLVEIAKEYKDKGVEVIGLTNEDPETDAEMVKQFSQTFNINYPIGWADGEMQQGLMQGRGAIPQTYIIGRDGKILKRFVGFSRDAIPQMKAVLEAAVSEG
ncbi:MAG TPA: TlpA disulfide reductase family protein [Blastocatellia bacterium]|nr:TlpA disulfide reductase family protein [Blastocatellia bacterium]